jgi:deoxyribodipyrimidine photo-lyase
VRTAVVLFTRDLRVRDHPALAEAARGSDRLVPLFVLDDRLLASGFARPNRLAFLLEALGDLDASLSWLGAGLVLRRGDPVAEAVRVAREARAAAIHVTADVSAYARARERRLADACRGDGLALRVHPGVTVVPPDALRPAGADHFRVFTPYWRRWRETPRRDLAGTPRRLAGVAGLRGLPIPRAIELAGQAPSPELPRGGEREGRRRLERWLGHGLSRYGEGRDDLAADRTSRLSPYLHFGCLSPLLVARRAAERAGAEPFLRQLCWRDFFHQLAFAFPRLARDDYRARGHAWRHDPGALAAWKAGCTGFPLVDAGMRQLAREGWMPNRARLVTASFLVKTLGLDWRSGAGHFLDWLVDGDIANNSGNWQWMAGTGTDARPHRVLSPVRQGRRFDPAGEYVRRHVPELDGVRGVAIHEPWRLPAAVRRALRYPGPIAPPRRPGRELGRMP